jgi:hypothetical protein
MPRTALLAVASLLVATALPATVVGTAEAAKPKPKPKLTATAPTVAESAAKAVVTVRLPKKAKQAVKVGWRTVDRTAKAGSDYRAGKGTATIKKGKKVATISIALLGDKVHEGTETFTVRLSSGKAKVPAKPVTVTITDDDAAGPPAPTAPSALTGTVTVSTTSVFPSGTTTLTMDVHLVPTGTSGKWRDNGTGSWTMTGSLMGAPGVCIMPVITTISGGGAFLAGTGVPVSGQSTLLLDDFDAVGATGTPSLSWAGRATSSTPTWVFNPMTPGICTPGATSIVDYPFSVAAPGASGTYTGTTGPGRGVSFAYDVPGSLSVTGSLTPVS